MIGLAEKNDRSVNVHAGCDETIESREEKPVSHVREWWFYGWLQKR